MDDLFVHPTINFGHIDIKNLSYSARTPNQFYLLMISNKIIMCSFIM